MSSTVESPKGKWVRTVQDTMGTYVPEMVRDAIFREAEDFWAYFRDIEYEVGPAVSAQIGVEALNEMLTKKYNGNPLYLFVQEEIPTPPRKPEYIAIISGLEDPANLDTSAMQRIAEASGKFNELAAAAHWIIDTFGEEQGPTAIASFLQEEVLPKTPDGNPGYDIEIVKISPAKEEPMQELPLPLLSLWERIAIRGIARMRQNVPAEGIIQSTEMDFLRITVGNLLNTYNSLERLLDPRPAAVIAASSMELVNPKYHFIVQEQFRQS